MKPADFIKEDFVTDAHEAHQDHEVQMARSDCYNAAKYAIELHKLLKNISEQQGLDGWVSEKITIANDYLRTVHEYLTYEQHSQAMPSFDPEVAEMQIESVISEAFKLSDLRAAVGSEGNDDISARLRNKGYEPGFASPHAPKLGGRRQDDEYVNGDPVNNIEVSINGRPWKIFAGKGPDGSKAFFQQKQSVDEMCKRKTAETGKEWSWGVTGAPATNEAVDEGAMDWAKRGAAAAALVGAGALGGAALQAHGADSHKQDIKSPVAAKVAPAKVAPAKVSTQAHKPSIKAPQTKAAMKTNQISVPQVGGERHLDDPEWVKNRIQGGYHFDPAKAEVPPSTRRYNENAGGMGAASVGTAMAGNGFANGGPGTISRPKLKKAKK